MSGWEALRRLLETDEADVGCGQAGRLLAAYVERQLEFADAETAYAGVAAHLSFCDPCAEDFRGLLALTGSGG